jgi:hypothetical protein
MRAPKHEDTKRILCSGADGQADFVPIRLSGEGSFTQDIKGRSLDKPRHPNNFMKKRMLANDWKSIDGSREKLSV